LENITGGGAGSTQTYFMSDKMISREGLFISHCTKCRGSQWHFQAADL